MVSKLLVLSTAIAACNGASVARQDAKRAAGGGGGGGGGGGMLSLPVERAVTSRQLPVLNKRAVPDTNVPLYNFSSVNYLISLSIGTPAQTVKVTIDTGSDELWVSPDCSDSSLSQLQQGVCTTNGNYNPSKSKTAADLEVASRIPYGKGSVDFEYYSDSFSLPDSIIKLNSVTFGVATASQDIYSGILGLSYGNGVNLEYNNFVDELVEQNVTATRAFTVALGSSDADNGGVLIFGGADTSKFVGELARLPVLPPQGKETIARYWVQMDAVGLTSPNGTAKTYAGGELPVVLDSGSSLSYLPSAIVAGIARDLGGVYDRDLGFYFVDCAMRAWTNYTVDFAFSGHRLPVSLREFIWDLDTGSSCVIGAQPVAADSGITALLGDSVMRSVYTIFDQTGGAVWVAPYANCGQSEVAIGAAGPAGLKGACTTTAAAAAAAGSGSGGKNAGVRVGGGAGVAVAAGAVMAVMSLL